MAEFALSIKQPWAWLILHAGKDIENRDWPTRFRGRVLIHTGKQPDPDAMPYVLAGLRPFDDHSRHPILPRIVTRADMPLGGIVGSVEIVDCVDDHPSEWFLGDYGFVLRNPQPLPFRPYRGQLGFFKVESALSDPRANKVT